MVAQGKHILKICLFDEETDDSWSELLKFAPDAEVQVLEEVSFTITVWCDEGDALVQELLPDRKVLVTKINKFNLFKDVCAQGIASIKNIKVL